MDYETQTIAKFQNDERFEKLKRSLKLAQLKKDNIMNTYTEFGSSIPTWPSVSNINEDTFGSNSIVTPSLQITSTNSEVIASSNNLKDILLRKRNYNTNRKMTTSSVKRYNDEQNNNIDQYIMPPPMVNTICPRSKKLQDKNDTSAEYKKLSSMPPSFSPIQPITVSTNFSTNNTLTSVSTDVNRNKKYPHSFVKPPITSINEPYKIDKIFFNWKVALNDQHQLIIKGTLECGRIARSKPIIRRCTATCVESVYRHKYGLQGNIVDERDELPDYVRGKFYNGFPDDWENVYQIWKTFVNQGCPVIFHWPTRITDSDDDLKSELTDLTYTHITRNRTNETKSYECIKSTGQLNKSKSLKNKSPEIVKNYSHDLQNCEEDCLSVKSTSNVKIDKFVQTNTNSENEKQYINKIKDILQENKFKIIINNLENGNYSPKYMDKVIEMFDCFDYLISYKTKSNHDSNFANDFTNSEICKSVVIPIQQNHFCNEDSLVYSNKQENMMQSKNYVHSFDLGNTTNIKNTSHCIQLPNKYAKKSVESTYNDQIDSDKSESDIYAGVPKISIERVIRAEKASRKISKYKVKKKSSQLNAHNYTANMQYNVNVKNGFTTPTTDPVTNIQKDLFLGESCISIIEDEIEVPNSNKAENMQRSQETSYNHQELQRKNVNIYEENVIDIKTHVQNGKQSDIFDTERVKPKFIKEINYINSNVEKDGEIAINMQKIESAETSHINLNQNVDFINKSNNNADKPHLSYGLHKELFEQVKNESAVTKTKPFVVKSIPTNLTVKMKKMNPQNFAQLYNSDVSIVSIVSIVDNENEQYSSGCPVEESGKQKFMPNTLSVAKSINVANDLHSKMIVYNNKENAIPNSAHNDKSELHITNPTSLIKSATSPIGQLKSKNLIEKTNPKILTSWMPKVIYNLKSKTELGLIFQGKLLNEVRHVINRKFTTNIVLRRLSATLIETIDHEFYQLLGCLNNSNHVIPKELVQQCRNGCPANIEQFCLTWKSLQRSDMEKINKNIHNTTIDSLSVPVSSRGRKILPPLSYWTGERIALKDNTPVYNSGNSQEALTSLSESPNKTFHIEEKKNKKINIKNTSKESSVNKQKLFETNIVAVKNKNQEQYFNKLSNAKTELDDNSTKEIKRFEKSSIKRKIRQMVFSTDSEEDDQKHVRNSRLNKEAEFTMKLRTRQKKQTPAWSLCSEDNISDFEDSSKFRDSRRKRSGCNLEFTYYRGIPGSDDLLSEDQVSFM